MCLLHHNQIPLEELLDDLEMLHIDPEEGGRVGRGGGDGGMDLD